MVWVKVICLNSLPHRRKNMSERLFGLIGYPLEHSFSQSFFSNKFHTEKIKNCKYELFPIRKITMLPKLINKNPNLAGLNVTIPYKQQVLQYLSGIEPVADRIGAVNTLGVESGLLHGYNSDVYGFEKSLIEFLGPSFKGNGLVLGTGGASRAVIYVLEDLGIHMTLVSRFKRSGMITYDEVTPDVISRHHLIINTTPLGMKPNVKSCPEIPYLAVTSSHYLYDLVYNPEETVFLKKGRFQGAKTTNGMAMLILQAERSWEIWNR